MTLMMQKVTIWERQDVVTEIGLLIYPTANCRRFTG